MPITRKNIVNPTVKLSCHRIPCRVRMAFLCVGEETPIFRNVIQAFQELLSQVFTANVGVFSRWTLTCLCCGRSSVGRRKLSAEEIAPR